MTPVEIAALLDAAAQLATLIQSIRANHPEAWADVQTDYAEAVAGWNAATAAKAS